jgi:hypothetical protein
MKGMVNFDYGVASIFGQWLAHMGDEHASVKYVDVLNDIIKLGYGLISTLIILMQCARVRNKNDVRGNPTYKRDEVGFLLANFLIHDGGGQKAIYFSYPSPTSILP